MKKSRATAVLLGLVVPGIGHVYLGALMRALFFLAMTPAIAIAFAVVAPEVTPAVMIGALLVILLVPRIAATVDVIMLPPERHRPVGAGAGVGLVLGGLVLAQATAFILRAFVMEAFKVPAGSMMPTILVGDHFFADKASYRHRDPRRGEVIVFRYPEHPEQDFVKRVAALGGDELAVRDGALLINGWEAPRCKVGAWTYAESFDNTTHKGTLYIEYLDDAAYYVFLDDNSMASGFQGPYHVKEGETFVLGDNRNNSHDSRMWWGGEGGGVPRANVKGRARLLWLSPVPGRAFTDVAELGPPPSPELAEGVKRCVAERPPREKTSPPSSKKADR